MIHKKIALLNQTTLESLKLNDRDIILKKFMQTGIKILRADFGWAWWKIDKKYSLAYKSSKTPYNPNYPRRRGGNYVAQKTKKPLFVGDVNKKPVVIKHQVGPYMKAYVIIPIFSKKNSYGNMVFCFKKAHLFSPEEQALCAALSSAAAQAITIHRLVTSERKARTEAEQHSSRFRALIENSHDTIILISGKGKILYVSPSVKRNSGYGPEELVGHDQTDFIYPGDIAKVATEMGKILQNPQATTTIEFRYRHKNGAWRWLESTAMNMLHNQHVRCIVINARDVTERRRLDEDAKNLMKQKDEFFSVASHELKTPVTTIKGFSQLLSQRLEKKDKKSRQFLATINSHADKLNHLINDFLDVSRISTGKLKFRYGTFNLTVLAKKTIADLKVIIHSHNITFKNSEDFWIAGDQERVGEVITNLLTNAAKYSPAGSKIILSITGEKQRVKVSVEDFGIGIPKKLRHKIFTRFFQAKTHSAQAFPGLGLGLYISSVIIKEHKGSLDFVSKNKGSIFYFILPVKNSRE